MDCIRRKLRPLGVMLWGSLAIGSLAACGDDTVSGVSMSGSGSGGESSTTELVPGTIGADETAVGTAEGTGTSTGIDPDSTGGDTESETDTDTGEPVDPGQASGAFVNAGSHALSSPGFRLLFTFGQASQNQNTMSSPGYRLRGGFVPATQ